MSLRVCSISSFRYKIHFKIIVYFLEDYNKRSWNFVVRLIRLCDFCLIYIWISFCISTTHEYRVHDIPFSNFGNTTTITRHEHRDTIILLIATKHQKHQRALNAITNFLDSLKLWSLCCKLVLTGLSAYIRAF